MLKKKILLIGLVAAGLLIVGILLAFSLLKPSLAAILIESTPNSVVFINSEQSGHTPFEGKYSPGEITVKLVPESFDKPLAPYETKVTLVSRIKTVIRRSIGESDDTSAGEVISFEKTGADEASLSIISTPDAAQINLDGQVKGFTPLKISSISSGKHELSLSSGGFNERTFSIEAVEGYRLTAIVKLSSNGESKQVSESSEFEKPDEKKHEVEILSTPTGFLRVRKEPSSLAAEVGRVKPGEKYKLLEEDQKTGWFKIEFEEGKEDIPASAGWVSNQYAKKS